MIQNNKSLDGSNLAIGYWHVPSNLCWFIGETEDESISTEQSTKDPDVPGDAQAYLLIQLLS